MLSDLAEQPVLLIPLQVLLLTVPAIVLGALFRAIGLPGGRGAAAVCGGILAGVLFGSLVLGSAAPQVHDTLIRGAQQERWRCMRPRTNCSARKPQPSRRCATGVSEVAEDELMADINASYEPRLTAARETLEAAQDRHTERLSIIVGALAGLVFASAYFRRTRTEISERPPGAPARVGADRLPKVLGPFPPAPVELLMLVMAAAPTAIVSRWLLGVDIPVAIAFGLVLAVPGATLRRAQSLSGGWAFLIAALLISVCSTAAFGTSTASTVLIGTAMAGSIVLLVIDNSLLRTRRAEIRFHNTLYFAILLPALAGALATTVDLSVLIDTGAFWIALVIGLIASGDVRWFGYGIAIRYFADPPANRSPMTIGNSAISAGAPVLQIVLTALAFRAMPEAGSLAFAALCGAALLELSRGLRARIATPFDDILRPDSDSPDRN
ncbi:MAG: hypothetical protein ACFHWZ_01015 [Phycisphaerales bacterium]